jgi:hypothetical protein
LLAANVSPAKQQQASKPSWLGRDMTAHYHNQEIAISKPLFEIMFFTGRPLQNGSLP